jgi:hypothetical protein
MPDVAVKETRHRVQQERPHQAIRLGEVQRSLKSMVRGVRFPERVPGRRLRHRG